MKQKCDIHESSPVLEFNSSFCESPFNQPPVVYNLKQTNIVLHQLGFCSKALLLFVMNSLYACIEICVISSEGKCFTQQSYQEDNSSSPCSPAFKIFTHPLLWYSFHLGWGEVDIDNPFMNEQLIIYFYYFN